MYDETPAAKPRQHRYIGRRSGVGTGTTSLLMIFTVLCFATLAMLSLSTANTSRMMQERGLENAQLTAQARGQAAQQVAVLDEALLALQKTPLDEAAYYVEAEKAAEGLGWAADAEAHTVSLVLPMNDETQLVTTLQLNAPGSSQRYALVAQAPELIEGWQAEGEGPVWAG